MRIRTDARIFTNSIVASSGVRCKHEDWFPRSASVSGGFMKLTDEEGEFTQGFLHAPTFFIYYHVR